MYKRSLMCAEQAGVAVEDAEGQMFDMKFSIKRSDAGNIARYIAGVGVWMRAWACREGDTISFEVSSLQPLTVTNTLLTSPHC